MKPDALEVEMEIVRMEEEWSLRAASPRRATGDRVGGVPWASAGSLSPARSAERSILLPKENRSVH